MAAVKRPLNVSAVVLPNARYSRDSKSLRSFDCSGTCHVGTYVDGKPPTLGDMAFADDDEIFKSDESGYIRGGTATHK